MSIFSPDDFKSVEASAPVHLAVGIFDGVHRGHRAVLNSAICLANDTRGEPCVMTFEPHPSRLFRPDNPTRMMNTINDRKRKISKYGIKRTIVQEFNAQFAAMQSSDFVFWLKEKIPQLRSIHVGENFKFGHERRGNIEILSRCAKDYDIDVYPVKNVFIDGEVVSSTYIRKLLNEGNLLKANEFLSDFFDFVGPVVNGKALGRQIGYPTLNFNYYPEFCPKFGVYLAAIQNKRNLCLPSIANFGVKPTVQSNTINPQFEVHVLCDTPEFEQFQFGFERSEARVILLDFVRAEQKFSSLNELSNQIQKDVVFAKQWWKNSRYKFVDFGNF